MTIICKRRYGLAINEYIYIVYSSCSLINSYNNKAAKAIYTGVHNMLFGKASSKNNTHADKPTNER